MCGRLHGSWRETSFCNLQREMQIPTAWIGLPVWSLSRSGPQSLPPGLFACKSLLVFGVTDKAKIGLLHLKNPGP